jgi:cob(I)alamin adenosyltransferase
MGEVYLGNPDCARDVAAERVWHGARADRRSVLRADRVLGKLNIALRYDYLDLAGVLEVLTNRRPDLHVVVTGRNAKPELVAAADLVTEMGQSKHHFAAGVKAQRGIEF